jgi:hypothetical protein
MEGDRALDVIRDLHMKMWPALRQAAIHIWNTLYADREPEPLPPGVYYDDGVVRITEEDVKRATRQVADLMDEVEEDQT